MWAGGPPNPIRPIRSHSLAITLRGATSRVHTGKGMGNPNIERVYQTLVAYQQGDEQALRGLIHPEGEIYGAPGIVNAGTYHGYEGFREWVSHWEEAWEEISYEFGDLVEIDPSVIVAPVHIVGRGAGSGIEIDRTFGWLYQWEDGQMFRYQVHPSFDEAMKAGKGLVADGT
jgi:ketosteroid isomerase-like protein